MNTSLSEVRLSHKRHCGPVLVSLVQRRTLAYLQNRNQYLFASNLLTWFLENNICQIIGKEVAD